MESFASIIALWPSAEDLAQDISVPGVTVRQWRRRDSIPPRHWNDIVQSAAARGLSGVTVQHLADIAAASVATGRVA